MKLLMACIHVLASATWLGAMVYSAFVLHPRASRYFESASQFEEFIATVSQGARWKVLGGLAVIGGSGLCLMDHQDARLLAIKGGLWLAACALFVHVSWRLWPARIFATGTDIARYQAIFRSVALTMIGIAAASSVIGVLMRWGV